MSLTDGHIRLDLSGDANLMREAALGRSAALKIIMERYMPMVSRTAYRILCDRSESEDVTREVFMKVWRNASSCDERYSVSTWLYRITCSLCFDRLRRRRFLELFAIHSPVYEESAPVASSPEEDFITKETWAVFCRACQGLSPKQRVVFTLRELEGLPVGKVAEITGMTPEQIKSNLCIAEQSIIQELERYGKVR